VGLEEEIAELVVERIQVEEKTEREGEWTELVEGRTELEVEKTARVEEKIEQVEGRLEECLGVY
jgi:hypothetical protein